MGLLVTDTDILIAALVEQGGLIRRDGEWYVLGPRPVHAPPLVVAFWDDLAEVKRAREANRPSPGRGRGRP